MIPTMDEMPRRNLPVTASEDALLSVACACFVEDMAGAIEGGRMVEGCDVPTAVMSARCTVKDKTYRLTVTVRVEPEASKQ